MARVVRWQFRENCVQFRMQAQNSTRNYDTWEKEKHKVNVADK